MVQVVTRLAVCQACLEVSCAQLTNEKKGRSSSKSSKRSSKSSSKRSKSKSISISNSDSDNDSDIDDVIAADIPAVSYLLAAGCTSLVMLGDRWYDS